jgi:hypothetical protein
MIAVVEEVKPFVALCFRYKLFVILVGKPEATGVIREILDLID